LRFAMMLMNGGRANEAPARPQTVDYARIAD
jgi:hypothetical protein